MREWTMREDADNGIKKSVLKRKNRNLVAEFRMERSQNFMRKLIVVDSEEESYP